MSADLSKPGPAEAVADNELGRLLGRPDLSDADIRAAIAERLEAEGRHGSDPDIVLEATRLRKRKAVAFLRKLVLPPPRAPLSMPVRPILRSQIRQARDGRTLPSPHS